MGCGTPVTLTQPKNQSDRCSLGSSPLCPGLPSSPRPQGAQLRSPGFLPRAGRGSVPNQRTQTAARAPSAPEEGPRGHVPDAVTYLSPVNRQRTGFPLQWLLRSAVRRGC